MNLPFPHSRFDLVRIGTALLLGLSGVLGLSLPGAGQALHFDSTAATLRTRVHLRLGSTTLQQTLKALSMQTGLQIHAADYLQERVLIAQLDNLSARQVLEALAECHDWSWREREKGDIIVERPSVPRPASLLEVPAAFARVMPADLRRFIGRDVPESEVRAAYGLQHPELNKRTIETVTKSRIMLDRLFYQKEKARKSFLANVTADMLSGKKVPYSALSPQQKQDLTARFVFEALQDVCTVGPQSAKALIYGLLVPDQIDENKMLIQMNGGALVVGTLIDGHFSFGEGISSHRELPDPVPGFSYP